MDLVVVESPTKAKTLSKFLGNKYSVVASMGHISDLPKSELGVDVDHNFEPKYVISPNSKAVVKTLKDNSKNAETIWLSTDPDREGEAIAWHISQVLSEGKVKSKKAKVFKRAVFHEITKKAVEEAFQNPRELDNNLVNSQQARRVLDRLVGYKLSPLLWKKVRYGLSAGRVQSVAVRFIVERERARQAFKPKEYWTIEASFTNTQNEQFRAQLSEISNQKIDIKTEQDSSNVLQSLKKATYSVYDIKTEEKRKYPYAPFTTSSLQQAAGNRFSFTASRVMKAAQSLYERGLITYMRTDSTNLSTEALTQIRKFVSEEFGDRYLPEEPRLFKTKSRLAQEAHEAIRPTHVQNKSKELELTSDERKIYELIWQRSVSCQMKEAMYSQTLAKIEGIESSQTYIFNASGSVLEFDGWLKVFGSYEEEASKTLPSIKKGDLVLLAEATPSQHFTEPPPRFTEASLIKTLEEAGIGRPSTYAPTISTIISRGYVGREGRALFPQPVGIVVNDLLVKHFPGVVDFDFTAKLESDLDEIAEGKKEWVPIIREFYTPFEKLMEKKEKEIKKEDITTLEETDKKCPECGKLLVVKLGRYGKFLSCTGFPECKFAEPITPDLNETNGIYAVSGNGAEVENKVDESQLGVCPEDSGELTIKQGRFGKFVACKSYPKCKFTKPYMEKIGIKCPQCHDGDVIVKKSSKGKPFFGCSNYPKCKYASWTKPGADIANGENK